MSERTSYAPGTPCWVDLGTPDLDAAVEFYGGLFGWEVPEAENAEQTGGYRPAMKGGKAVGGVMPLMQEGQPPAWTTYVSVEDADATAAAVTEAGGSVIAEPMDVLDLGRMAVFADPTGAVFGIWQPGTLHRRRRRQRARRASPGTSSTPATPRRPRRSTARSSAGTSRTKTSGEAGTYTTIKLGEDTVGGMLDIDRRGVPDEVPPHWLVYFAVEDTDATLEKAKERGGSVMFGPMDIPVGPLRRSSPTRTAPASR